LFPFKLATSGLPFQVNTSKDAPLLDARNNNTASQFWPYLGLETSAGTHTDAKKIGMSHGISSLFVI
jgi:hypothetical protein